MIARSPRLSAAGCRGLYAIADTGIVDASAMPAAIQAALLGGAALLQYRCKDPREAVPLPQLRNIATMCRHAGVPFIVNDDPELAATIGADGVHVGIDDPDPGVVRRHLGEHAIVGVSCYDSLERAAAAAAEGADYIAFGRFYPSPTKPDAVPADPAILRTAKQQFTLPVAAIGGITPDNAATLIHAGADLIAAVSGVFATPDPQAAAAAYQRLFQTVRGFAAPSNLP